jgi:hypothetical protein
MWPPTESPSPPEPGLRHRGAIPAKIANVTVPAISDTWGPGLWDAQYGTPRRAFVRPALSKYDARAIGARSTVEDATYSRARSRVRDLARDGSLLYEQVTVTFR